MELTQQEIFDAFGLEAPQATQGAQPEEEAGSAQQAGQQGPEDQQENTQAESGNMAAAPEGAEDAGAAGTPEQTPEERREHAAQRRRQEQQAAIDRAVQEALARERAQQKQEWDGFFKKAGLQDTISGKPIGTKEEFDAWEKAYSAAKMQQELQEGRLTPEMLERAIEDNPTVKRAQQILQQQEDAQQQEAQRAAQARIQEELQEIHAINPQIRTAQDILQMPTGQAFYEYVQKGLSFRDAYYLANREGLAAQTEQRARQAAAVNQRGKEHLLPTGGARSAGAVSVPPEELQAFRAINPEASDEEILRFYNKYRK